MGPKSPEHENAITCLHRWLVASVDLDAYDLFVTRPLTLGGSEPEPDLAVTERWNTETQAHPSSALLVIEVAHSSQLRDLGVKPALYAPYVTGEAGVIESVQAPRTAGNSTEVSSPATASDRGTAVAPAGIRVTDEYAPPRGSRPDRLARLGGGGVAPVERPLPDECLVLREEFALDIWRRGCLL